MKKAKKILVVEDEPAIRLLYRRLLIPKGYEVVFANGTAEAARSIEAPDGFDLLITDIKFPDGSGIDVLSLFRRKNPAAKMLIVTGSPSPELEMERLAAIGLSEQNILFKPFELHGLEETICKYLGET